MSLYLIKRKEVIMAITTTKEKEKRISPTEQTTHVINDVENQSLRLIEQVL
jgi:hypothetical protein